MEATKIKEGYYKIEDDEGTPYILITNNEGDEWEAQIIIESEFGYGATEEEAIQDVIKTFENEVANSEEEEE